MSIPRSNPGALPKYLAIAEMLTRDIRAGRLADGERLPGERDMAQSLDCSVGTLRNALALMEERGMLSRVQGSGNYIRVPKQDQSLYAFFRLEKHGGGGLPSARILGVDWQGADQRWRIRRVRALDGEDIALEEIKVRLPEAAALDQLDLSESLYLTYRTEFNLWITRAEDAVHIDAWPKWSPLAKTDGQAIAGRVDRQGWDQNGELAETSTTWFEPSRAKYISRLA